MAGLLLERLTLVVRRAARKNTKQITITAITGNTAEQNTITFTAVFPSMRMPSAATAPS